MSTKYLCTSFFIRVGAGQFWWMCWTSGSWLMLLVCHHLSVPFWGSQGQTGVVEEFSSSSRKVFNYSRNYHGDRWVNSGCQTSSTRVIILRTRLTSLWRATHQTDVWSGYSRLQHLYRAFGIPHFPGTVPSSWVALVSTCVSIINGTFCYSSTFQEEILHDFVNNKGSSQFLHPMKS